ncbi:N-glycosylase DNA lyase [Aspergillus sclerotialis]|uniref:DNA-(apurinic or apyrimidinic site) lyase n=1 Tax=Aspergillus sclerotialis TaxID=2070753 RepID=A0A3A2ZTZ3_9EURO|nr:N-glycosylase DNA lyase [Aspergillus sclerotialis]
MTIGVFSEWYKLPLSLSELCINTTLRCGQSFRWHNVPDSDEWRCVLHGCLLSLRQDPNYLYYRTYRTSKPLPPSSNSPQQLNASDEKSPNSSNDNDILRVIKHYFNLSSNLTDLYSQWSSQDPNFKKKASHFTGIRILRQDAWEALVSFICSSNNNISRISQMVEKLCLNYGRPVATIDGRAYHDFPPPEALTGKDVETRLRNLGFGYRAKYIYQTAVMVAEERESGWLNGLQNPESPAFGVDPVPGGEMKPEGRDGYRHAHEKLVELQGVGPKVADCVCLMGLGWGEAVPVDTHVWQIAQRDYKFGKSGQKTLNKATYDAVGNLFRKLWGKEAGWAHSVLFTADLRAFSDRLAASKAASKVEVDVKEEEDDTKIEMKVTTTTLKRPLSEDDVKAEVDEKPQKNGSALQTSLSTGSTRMSKRLRNR